MTTYTVTIHWNYDDSYTVHHFQDYPGAECFFRGAVKDADHYHDAHSVMLKDKTADKNIQWQIYK